MHRTCAHNYIFISPVASLERGLDKRPKSSATPGFMSHKEASNQQVWSEDRNKLRKRSYSAVLPRNVSDEALRQLLLISRQTALSHKGLRHRHTYSEPTPTKTLPPVVSHGELGMKIEVKGLRSTNSPRNSPRGKNSPRHHKGHLESNSPGRKNSPKHQRDHLESVVSSHSSSGRLPPISDPPQLEKGDDEKEVIDVKVTVSTSKPHPQDHDKDKDGEESLTSSANQSTFPPKTVSSGSQQMKLSTSSGSPKMNVVSIGEAREVGRTNIHRSKRHTSGKGRLSSGWSPPQPIQPLKGSPIHTPPKKTGGAGQENEGERDLRAEVVASPTPSMTINVNVNEFLEQAETGD